MRTLTILCDRCKKTPPTGNYSYEVAVSVRELDHNGKAIQHKPALGVKQEEWCRECVITVLGTIPTYKTDPPKAEPAPTLEDMIREIAGEAATEAAIEAVRSR